MNVYSLFEEAGVLKATKTHTSLSIQSLFYSVTFIFLPSINERRVIQSESRSSHSALSLWGEHIIFSSDLRSDLRHRLKEKLEELFQQLFNLSLKKRR